MSQNFSSGGSTPGQGTGGAGTGATDAGTTRDTSATSGAGGAGTGQSMTTGGGGGAQGAGGGTGTATGLTQTAQEYGQKIAGAASTAREYVTDKVSVVGDKLGELRNKDFSEVATEAKEYARQNPGQALLISAAAGFVLGLLIRGSRR